MDNSARIAWKAFAIWVAFPYLFSVLVVPGTLLLVRHDVALVSLLRWRSHAYVLAACALSAGLGTVILWVLPIRRVWLGMIAGPILAFGGVALWVLLRVTLFGGFEANAGTAATAMVLLLPSCLAGAYAGFLRAKEQQAEIPR